MFDSVQRILSLPDQTRIFVGHDYKAPGRDQYAWESTVGTQRAANVHIGAGRAREDFVAIREARDACDMYPISKDALTGVELITNLAIVYALTGEKDRAVEQLEIVNKLPGGPTYGQLRLDPEWESLRGDPRFEKIVASLAPKKGSP